MAVMAHVGAGAVVLAGATAVALGDLPDWERRTFSALNGGPDWLEPMLWTPMQLGSLFGPFVVAGAAWWRFRDWRPTAGAVVAGVGAWEAAKLVKDQVNRGRPTTLMAEFAQRTGTPSDGLGFVSGHSAVAFALAAVVSPYLGRKGRAAAYAVATTVGFARVHVSAHLPLDVVGGAALGYTIGWGWHLAVGIPVGRRPHVNH